jgi:hypothetical protein
MGSGQTIIHEKGEKIIDTERVFVADDYGSYAQYTCFRPNSDQFYDNVFGMNIKKL